MAHYFLIRKFDEKSKTFRGFHLVEEDVALDDDGASSGGGSSGGSSGGELPPIRIPPPREIFYILQPVIRGDRMSEETYARIKGAAEDVGFTTQDHGDFFGHN